MKQLFFILLLIISCKGDTVPEPKNLISEKKMSEIIADFAISDQLGLLNEKGDMEISSQYVLEQHKISAKQFSESYEYYISMPHRLEKILNNAQNLVLKKSPDAKDYIEKQEEKAENLTSEMR